MALTLVITDAGRAALVNARNDGTNAVRIASAGVSATAIVASPAATTLSGETKRVPTISGAVVARDVIHLVVQDETMDSYTLRSFALYLDNGVLFALYGQATSIIEKSAQALMLLAIDVTLQDVAAGQVAFGDANFLQPPATVDRPGVIELATEAEAMAGVDRIRAVTPYTLRITYGDVWRASNDGAGSGLDADLVRGLPIPAGTWMPLSGVAITMTDPDTIPVGGSAFTMHASVPSGPFYVASLAGGDVPARGFQIGSPYAGSDLYMRSRPAGWIKLWSTGNDGAGSGLDADLLDGRQAAEFALLAGSEFTGPVHTTSPTGFVCRGAGPLYQFLNTAGNVRYGYLQHAGPGGTLAIVNDQAGQIQLITGGNGVLSVGPSGASISGTLGVSVALSRAGNIVWDAGNDGAGSGLDADLLDGMQGAQFVGDRGDIAVANIDQATANGFYRVNYPGFSDSLLAWTNGSSTGTVQMSFGYQGGLRCRNRVDNVDSRWSAWNSFWHSNNDGSGSGLDADIVRGRAIPMGAWVPLTGATISATDPDTIPTGGAAFATHPKLPSSAVFYVASLAPGDVADRGFQIASPYATSDLYMRSRPADWTKIWSSGNDGAGSGLDADMVDGRHGSEFALLSGAEFTGSVATTGHFGFVARAVAPLYQFLNTAGTVRYGYIQHGGAGGTLAVVNDQGAAIQLITGGIGVLTAGPSGVSMSGTLSATGPITRAGNLVWDAGNDGSGSGLDADLLDGWDRDDIRRWGNLLDVPGAFPPAGHTHSAADIAGAFANASFGPSGYQVLPNGLILQWCTGALNSTGSEPAQFVGFPITFPNSCFVALVSTRIAGTSNGADAFYQTAGEPLTNGVTVQRQYTAQGSDNRATTPFVIAIGN